MRNEIKLCLKDKDTAEVDSATLTLTHPEAVIRENDIFSLKKRTENKQD